MALYLPFLNGCTRIIRRFFPAFVSMKKAKTEGIWRRFYIDISTILYCKYAINIDKLAAIRYYLCKHLHKYML